MPKSENITDTYLFHLFNAKQIDLQSIGFKAFGKSLNSAFLKEEVEIPLPPLDVQQQIVSECEAIESKVKDAIGKLEISKVKIEKLLKDGFNQKYDIKKLSEICVMQAGKFVSASEIQDELKEDLYPCYGGNG